MKFYFYNSLVFLWDIFLIGGSTYLVANRDWDPFTILFAALLLGGFKSEKEILEGDNKDEEDD